MLNGDSTRYQARTLGCPRRLHGVGRRAPRRPGAKRSCPELRRIRAQYHEPYERESVDEGAPDSDAWDAALDRYGDYDELVFWFEHDLFDQLILIRHLHWLSQITMATTRFSLICIGEYPGRPRFAGLGELRPPSWQHCCRSGGRSPRNRSRLEPERGTCFAGRTRRRFSNG